VRLHREEPLLCPACLTGADCGWDDLVRWPDGAHDEEAPCDVQHKAHAETSPGKETRS
jgi:hypothetical protein